MKPRILFVDDEVNVLESLQRMLRRESKRWDMDFMSSSEEASEAVRRQDFDAIVLDVTMPHIGGFELLEQVRSMEHLADVPVIILTGSQESNLKRRALDLGATDLLNKPIHAEDLIARLRNVLRLKQYQDELRAQNELLEQRVKERTMELEDSRLDIIWRLAKAAEHRDDETGNHVVRVGCYSRIIAESLGADRDFIETLFLASPLHDIGKIGMPDAILLKPGRLTEEEWILMRRHCAIGAEILREDAKMAAVFRRWNGGHGRPLRGGAYRNPILKMAAIIAMSHHEWWNGTGYPEGLSGDDIPLAARITALADVYDALRSKRPYKPAYSEPEALDILRGEVGRHFDPEIHAAFERSMEDVRMVRTKLADEIPELAYAGDRS